MIITNAFRIVKKIQTPAEIGEWFKWIIVIRRCKFYKFSGDFFCTDTRTHITIWNELKYRFGPRFLKLFLISFNDVSVLQRTATEEYSFAATGHLCFMFSSEFFSSSSSHDSLLYRMIIRLSRYEKSSLFAVFFAFSHFFWCVHVEIRRIETVGQHHDDVD